MLRESGQDLGGDEAAEVFYRVQVCALITACELDWTRDAV
jgi:hypothetical protein